MIYGEMGKYNWVFSSIYSRSIVSNTGLFLIIVSDIESFPFAIMPESAIVI